ncbi:hypothetical protein ACQ86N_17260 [Puia sp. P3]|uniref:hypothetical protein n=1 Tax=Puia sp. P3 TaxID=3423952 RepID=UPI003D66E793
MGLARRHRIPPLPAGTRTAGTSASTRTAPYSAAWAGPTSPSGSAIAGDSTWVFTAQETPAYNIGRYNRATKSRDLVFQGSSTTTATGDVIRGLGVFNGRVYAGDYAGNRIAVFTPAGILVRQWAVTSPGALAVDSNGFIWVAQMSSSTLLQFDTLGTAGTVIHMDTASRPSALYVDNRHGQLLVGDQGPDMNIKIYDRQSAALLGSFGVPGGYLNQTSGIRGQTGDKRFTRVVGIGRDTQGRLYVLNNPWGGTGTSAATARRISTATTAPAHYSGPSRPSTSKA